MTLSNREYLDSGGTRCPSCKAGNVEGGNIDVDMLYVRQPCWCTECGAQWVDTYTLDGYTELEEGNGT